MEKGAGVWNVAAIFLIIFLPITGPFFPPLPNKEAEHFTFPRAFHLQITGTLIYYSRFGFRRCATCEISSASKRRENTLFICLTNQIWFVIFFFFSFTKLFVNVAWKGFRFFFPFEWQLEKWQTEIQGGVIFWNRCAKKN